MSGTGPARAVLSYIREHGLLRAGQRVAAAVSGGADSVALLRLLLELRAELGIVLAIAHYHHRIRGAEADADAAFVAAFAREHGLELHSGAGDVPAHARRHGMSLEAAARELRYAWFRELMPQQRLHRIATGHTLDDQAETVLLRLIRGTGMRGLAGIYPQVVHPHAVRPKDGASAPGEPPAHAIVRPLLGTRRRELEDYLRAMNQPWREDASNLDVSHTRNRVRHKLLPLLESEFNPAVTRVLAETAEIARAEEDDWQREVARAAEKILVAGADSQDGVGLRLEPLARQPLAMQRRLLRLAAERVGLRLDFRQVEAVLRLLPGPEAERAPALQELPQGWVVRRQGAELRLLREPATSSASLGKGVAYELPLPVPGEVRVAQLGTAIRASLVAAGVAQQGYNRDQFLDPGLLPPELVVRNWRPGDRFWPAHTKSPKKVKSLLQERKIGQPERALWPVVAGGGTIVWMRGFAPPEQFRPGPDAAQALVIREVKNEEVDHEDVENG